MAKNGKRPGAKPYNKGHQQKTMPSTSRNPLAAYTQGFGYHDSLGIAEDKQITGLLEQIHQPGGVSDLLSMFFGASKAQEAAKPKPDPYDLGHGLRYEPIEPLMGCDKKVGNLYKDGVKVSDEIFSIGHTFKPAKFKASEHFTEIVRYTVRDCDHSYEKDPKKRAELRKKQPQSYDLGQDCIINSKGQVVVSAEQYFDHNVAYLGGIIGVGNKNVYDLTTGEVIVKHFSKRFESEDFIFFEVDYYSLYKEKSSPDGIYKVNRLTAEVEFFKAKDRN